MPRFQISHKTTYDYSDSVIQSHHLLHLVPRSVPHQSTRRQIIDIDPIPTWREDVTDYFGNPVTKIAIDDEHQRLFVHAMCDVDVMARAALDTLVSAPWHDVVRMSRGPKSQVADFISGSLHAPTDQEFAAFAAPFFLNNIPILKGVADLTAHIFSEFRFDGTATDISTPVATVLEQKAGVCQDFAHLEIATLRSIGIPARYVSGYILTHPAAGETRLIGADASHAWISVWAPDIGWVDFDPTNNLINSEDHITVAVGRDYEDVSPISGVLLGGGKHSVDVAVSVERVE